MERSDRAATIALLAGAAGAWAVVLLLVTTRDPYRDPAAAQLGALLVGAAVAVTATPLAWLAAHARNRRIAYRGAWGRAARRGGWAGLLAGAAVLLRVLGIDAPPILLFLAAIFGVAELTLSAER